MTKANSGRDDTAMIFAEPLPDTPGGRVKIVPVSTRADDSFMLYDDMFDLDTDGLLAPRFSVQEVAKNFFGRKSDWLRWRYKPDFDPKRPGKTLHHPDGYFILDGVSLEPKKTDKGARYYTLPDIERMAHALAQNNVIDGETLIIVLQVVVLVASLHGVFPDEIVKPL